MAFSEDSLGSLQSEAFHYDSKGPYAKKGVRTKRQPCLNNAARESTADDNLPHLHERGLNEVGGSRLPGTPVNCSSEGVPAVYLHARQRGAVLDDAAN